MTGTSELHGLGPDELRAAVRAVLRDVLPAGMVAAPAGATPAAASSLSGEVVVQTDADLTALVRRVASMCEDPAQRAALRSGRHGLRLVRDTGAGGTRPAGGTTGVMRIERGAVTERSVVKAASSGARLVVGPKAVLTPLARDKARVLGVEIEKER
jgi:hypothetical protein